eukprot:TRINITY_DN23030_c0_g1_i1.p1 TRINITY_DN23030_c0_g1~~TRINITY_DN23030_c0_g1_i1.p1  ORF type:complete len:307 (+),score=53.92 TRINITY_DN23030_c0_g1_i1:67-987(+)
MRKVMLTALCAALCRPCSAKVSALAVIPHGDFVYDPSLVGNDTGAVNLHKSAIAVGQWLDSAADAVFLSTPHGLELSSNFLVYLNAAEEGSATLGEDLHNSSFPGYQVRMNVSTDSMAESLVDLLGGHAGNVSGIKGFAGSMPLPISWGEIIPLSFLSDKLLQRVVLLGQPLRRYNDSVGMIPELLRLGGRLWRALESRDDRVAVVISSDLAHTHLASGPYGYCPCAEPYDQAVGRWARDMDAAALLRDAAQEQLRGAMSCGFTGMVMLQGLIAAAQTTDVHWSSHMYADYHPTYYGMMVASWQRQ